MLKAAAAEEKQEFKEDPYEEEHFLADSEDKNDTTKSAFRPARARVSARNISSMCVPGRLTSPPVCMRIWSQ